MGPGGTGAQAAARSDRPRSPLRPSWIPGRGEATTEAPQLQQTPDRRPPHPITGPALLLGARRPGCVEVGMRIKGWWLRPECLGRAAGRRRGRSRELAQSVTSPGATAPAAWRGGLGEPNGASATASLTVADASSRPRIGSTPPQACIARAMCAQDGDRRLLRGSPPTRSAGALVTAAILPFLPPVRRPRAGERARGVRSTYPLPGQSVPPPKRELPAVGAGQSGPPPGLSSPPPR